nr:MAG TPA: hypothetical protein [Caudoviricetes sp.]
MILVSHLLPSLSMRVSMISFFHGIVLSVCIGVFLSVII